MIENRIREILQAYFSIMIGETCSKLTDFLFFDPTIEAALVSN